MFLFQYYCYQLLIFDNYIYLILKLCFGIGTLLHKIVQRLIIMYYIIFKQWYFQLAVFLNYDCLLKVVLPNKDNFNELYFRVFVPIIGLTNGRLFSVNIMVYPHLWWFIFCKIVYSLKMVISFCQ